MGVGHRKVTALGRQVSAGDLSLKELSAAQGACTCFCLSRLVYACLNSACPQLFTCIHAYLCLACLCLQCPYLPSLVEACSYLLSPIQANTCPHLLMPALTCPHPSRLTPAHICCLHLSLPSMLTPALTCSCPYLLVPVHICQCLPMPTSAHACLVLLSPVHVHTCPYLLTPALTCPHLPMPTPVKVPPLPCHLGSLPVFQPHWVYCSSYFKGSCLHFSPGFLPATSILL